MARSIDRIQYITGIRSFFYYSATSYLPEQRYMARKSDNSG